MSPFNNLIDMSPSFQAQQAAAVAAAAIASQFQKSTMSDEQRERMMRNRQIAEEKRKAKLLSKVDSALTLSQTSQSQVVDESEPKTSAQTSELLSQTDMMSQSHEVDRSGPKTSAQTSSKLPFSQTLMESQTQGVEESGPTVQPEKDQAPTVEKEIESEIPKDTEEVDSDEDMLTIVE